MLKGFRYSSINLDTSGDDKIVLWSRSDFVKIMKSFRLPKRFTQMIGACHCMFARCSAEQVGGEGERICRLKEELVAFPIWKFQKKPQLIAHSLHFQHIIPP